MNLLRELKAVHQMGSLLAIATGYHLVKLAANQIDSEDGVLEQHVSQLLARRLLRQVKLEVDVRGAEQVEGLERYCVVCSHASHADWAVLLAHFPSPLRFIAKQELSSFPVIGHYLRRRGILIDRSKGHTARDAIIGALGDGEPWPILIFPEGTRSHDGTLGPFRKGGLRLLAEGGRPMVPVCIRGTFEALPRGTHLVHGDRLLRMVIGEPVRPGDYPSVDAALAEVERRMRALYEEAAV